MQMAVEFYLYRWLQKKDNKEVMMYRWLQKKDNKEVMMYRLHESAEIDEKKKLC